MAGSLGSVVFGIGFAAFSIIVGLTMWNNLIVSKLNRIIALLEKKEQP